MTLALGIVCDNGIVLGGYRDQRGWRQDRPKMLTFPEIWNDDFNVIAAAYGHADSMESVRVEITERLTPFKGQRRRRLTTRRR